MRVKTWMPNNGCQTMDAKQWMPTNGCVEVEVKVKQTTFQKKRRRRALGPS